MSLATAAAAATDNAPALPLHERIDRLIDSHRVGPAVELAGDAEFLRRISLDLTGMPPAAEELKQFLADAALNKRAGVVDRLLESPLHSRHLATTLNVMLMERRPNQHVAADEWQQYLLKACRENRPLNQVFKEILHADGADPGLRPASRFYLNRESEPNLITRDVGRIFFGRDMQCAHCHNHPSIDDYQQSDYHGLLAFFSSSYALVRNEGGKEKTVYAEKVGGDLAFDSVFVKHDSHRTGPRVLGGIEIAEPVFPPGEEYRVKPVNGVLPVPKLSRRAELASLATDGTNQAFNENIANRLWALMMGRGLVHPVDLHHPDNPPAHPDVLKLLADELAALKFDSKVFLRELALSKTYQRAGELPWNQLARAEEIAKTLAELKSRTGSLKAAAEVAQKDYDQAISAWHAAETTLVPVAVEQDQALVKHAAAAKKRDDAQKASDDALAKIAVRRDVWKALAEAAEKAEAAVKKLPGEKDLADAARKFTDRSKAVTAELASLEKAGADKSAALKKVIEEVAAAVKPVETARAKALPLREAVRAKERIVLAARKKTAESRIALKRQKNRLERLEAHLRRGSLEEQAFSVAQADLVANEAVVQAEKHLADYAAVLSRAKNEVMASDQARLSAEKTGNDAQTALDLQRKTETAVVEALNATDAARRQLADDSTLVEAARILKTKADELRAVSADLTSKRDAALEVVKKATDAVASAARNLDAAILENTRRDKALADAQRRLPTKNQRPRLCGRRSRPRPRNWRF